MLTFIAIGLITFRWSFSIRKHELKTIEFSKRLKNDPGFEGHLKRVSRLCQQIGVAMELPKKDIDELRLGGLFHDIGKIAIDDGILQKTDRLNRRELIEIKRHADLGYRILNAVPGMRNIALYVLSHHERFDGTGYPRGIQREEIPLISRIIAVADAYDVIMKGHIKLF